MLTGTAFAGPVQLPDRAPQGFDFPFVGVFLALGQFERFKHFFHVVEGFAQGHEDLVDLVDGLLNGRRRGRLGRGESSLGAGRLLSPGLRHGWGWFRQFLGWGREDFGLLGWLAELGLLSWTGRRSAATPAAAPT
ncbi:hypothetical protein SBV1_2980008 [Verrucomicrobia bacterium]|nr:hypothetical protein SBV1_2980008 [Verrucomicrobiota bacterium]